MKVKTCEEYVLNILEQKEEIVEQQRELIADLMSELEETNAKLQTELEQAYAELNKYKNLMTKIKVENTGHAVTVYGYFSRYDDADNSYIEFLETTFEDKQLKLKEKNYADSTDEF